MSKQTKLIVTLILMTIVLQTIPFYLSFLCYGFIKFGMELSWMSGLCVVINGILIAAIISTYEGKQ